MSAHDPGVAAGTTSKKLPETAGTPRIRMDKLSLRAGSVVAIIVIWIVCAWLVAQNFNRPASVLPYPWEVLSDLRGLAVFVGPGADLTLENAVGVIVDNSLDSAVRLGLGVMIGAMLGVGTGLLLGMSRIASMTLQIPLLLIRTIPLFALIPLFLTWFGGSDTGIVAYIAFGVFSMLLVSTVAAIENVPPVILDFARALGASRWRVYRTVVVPAIIPEVAGGLRVVVGIAWAILIGGELLGAQSGLGRILSLAEQFSYTGRMMLIVAIIMIYTISVDYFVMLLSNYLTRWAPDDSRSH